MMIYLGHFIEDTHDLRICVPLRHTNSQKGCPDFLKHLLVVFLIVCDVKLFFQCYLARLLPSCRDTLPQRYLALALPSHSATLPKLHLSPVLPSSRFT